MESVDHNADCPMQLFFYELQMAVTALLKQINIPRHQVPGFTILSPFYGSWKLSCIIKLAQEARICTYVYCHLFKYHSAFIRMF